MFDMKSFSGVFVFFFFLGLLIRHTLMTSNPVTPEYLRARAVTLPVSYELSPREMRPGAGTKLARVV